MAATYGGHDAGGMRRMFAGRAGAIMGLPTSGALGRRGGRAGGSLDHPFSLGLALTFRAASAQALGDLDAAAVYAEEATAIARDRGSG